MMRACAKCARAIPATERYCAEHKRAENARRNAKNKAFGRNSAHWQKVRKQRLELAGFRCELQLAGCTGVATHVHLDPSFRGQHRAASVEFCRACCASCSGAVDAPRSAEQRQGNRR